MRALLGLLPEQLAQIPEVARVGSLSIAASYRADARLEQMNGDRRWSARVKCGTVRVRADLEGRQAATRTSPRTAGSSDTHGFGFNRGHRACTASLGDSEVSAQ